MALINGTSILVKFGSAGSETAIACSTSCSLNINQEALEATCKDGDNWVNSIEGNRSWDVSVSALYQITDSENFLDISELITNSAITNLVSMVIGDSTTYWVGNATCVSISLTADDNSPATYEATFTGVGGLVVTTP